jgi:hypothetical protein
MPMLFPRRSDGSQRGCARSVLGDRGGRWQRVARRLSGTGQFSGDRQICIDRLLDGCSVFQREQFKAIAGLAIVSVEPDPFDR